MTTATAHPLVHEYLKELSSATRGLPAHRRRELMQEIEEHLREALPPDAGEAAVRTELDRLGDPQDIVAAEHDRPGHDAGVAPTATDWLTVVLLLLGGVVVPVLGWITGVVLLWRSTAWTMREKLIGTLAPPGGYMASYVFYVAFAFQSGETCGTDSAPGRPDVTHCTGGRSTTQSVLLLVLLGILAVLPLLTATYLVRQAKRA